MSLQLLWCSVPFCLAPHSASVVSWAIFNLCNYRLFPDKRARILDAEGLALGAQIAASKKRARDLIDGSFHRWARRHRLAVTVPTCFWGNTVVFMLFVQVCELGRHDRSSRLVFWRRKEAQEEACSCLRRNGGGIQAEMAGNQRPSHQTCGRGQSPQEETGKTFIINIIRIIH